jgi:transposase-like protein
VIVALGVDPKGNKHLLGVHAGATENSAVVTELLEDLQPTRPRVHGA